MRISELIYSIDLNLDKVNKYIFLVMSKYLSLASQLTITRMSHAIFHIMPLCNKEEACLSSDKIIKEVIEKPPEHISHTLREWAQTMGVELMYIQPGKSTQNAYIELFNRAVRSEWLNLHIFDSVEHAKN